MRAAVMQPYFLPYIGYWQLIDSVDVFVLLDDVNYIKRGWINRNRYLCDGRVQYFAMPVQKVSQNRIIKNTRLCYDRKQRKNLLRTFRYAYRKAPHTAEICALLERILFDPDPDLVNFTESSIRQISRCLEIDTPILRASALRPEDHKRGLEGVLEICQIVGADTYINPIGGMSLYDPERFRREGVELLFLKSDFDALHRLTEGGPADLSILDLMMRYDQEQIRQMLQCHTFITKQAFSEGESV